VSEIRAVKFNYVLEEDKSGLYSLEFEGDREMTTEEQLAALKVIRTRMDIIKSDVVPSSMWCNPRRYRLANVPEMQSPMVCEDCGALVADLPAHDAFHRRVDNA
jgi:hypothetical protein